MRSRSSVVYSRLMLLLVALSFRLTRPGSISTNNPSSLNVTEPVGDAESIDMLLGLSRWRPESGWLQVSSLCFAKTVRD